VPGQIQTILLRDGSPVPQGQDTFSLSPDEKNTWEALRGLYLVGLPEDVPVIEPFTHPTAGPSSRVREQARLAIEAIQRRAAK